MAIDQFLQEFDVLVINVHGTRALSINEQRILAWNFRLSFSTILSRIATTWSHTELSLISLSLKLRNYANRSAVRKAKNRPILPAERHLRHWDGTHVDFSDKIAASRLNAANCRRQVTLMVEPYRSSDKEEFWNCLTHTAGFGLSLVGAALLLPKIKDCSAPIFIAVVGYAAALIAVYACSSLSHYFRDAKRLALFRKLDQACIYLLIVASYTPFSIVYLNGLWWHFVLCNMWVLALVGFISKLVFAHRVESVAIWLYLLLGWMPFFSGMPFVGLIPIKTVGMFILGGVFYSAGTWFLFNDWRAWYFHSIWHIFVIAGSMTHFLAVYWFV